MNDLRQSTNIERLKDLVGDADRDAHKFYKKGNKTAGVRLRKQMQEIKRVAQGIRMDVQESRSQTT